jgi:signal peptidase II
MTKAGRLMLRYWLFLLATVLGLLTLDQASKSWIVANFALYEARTPIPALAEVFQLTYTRNTGAAFGLFQGGSNFFLVFAVLASGVILYFYRQLRGDQWAVRLALGLQLGGALGNAIDRVTRGYVVDFLHVFYEPLGFNYPVFNLADSAIVVGVLLLLLFLREDKKAPQATDSGGETAQTESGV